MTAQQQIHDTGVVRAVLAWVNIYTRALPAELAQIRRDELASDIYEQHTHASSRGISSRSLNCSIALRALRGLGADITWTITHHQRTKTMATAEVTPARRHLAAQLAAAIWGSVVVVALIGLISSITEMMNTGGTVHGLVAWPGAVNISLTLVVLIASVTALALTTTIAASWWRRSFRAV